MKGLLWRGRVGLALLGFLLLAPAAPAEPVSSFAVFGNNGVLLGQSSTVSGGLVGSNGDVQVNTFGNVQGILAGGSVTVLSAAAVNGDVLAGGNFSLGAFSTVQGNAGANGQVTFGNVFSRVEGDLRFGVPPAPPAGQVGGSITQGTVSVLPVAVPPADVFSAGGPNVSLNFFESRTLAPGSYGTLTLGGSNQLALSAGDYFFDSITNPSGFGPNLLLDLSGGGINIFVTGDVGLGTFTTATVNGQPFAGADQALAANVFLETRGQFTLGDASQFFGTVFAPDGNITVGNFDTVTGSLVSGGRVASASDIGPLTVNGVGAARFQTPPQAVPEPAGLTLLGLGALGLLGFRLRRRKGAA